MIINLSKIMKMKMKMRMKEKEEVQEEQHEKEPEQNVEYVNEQNEQGSS